jgi:hypothetical protein
MGYKGKGGCEDPEMVLQGMHAIQVKGGPHLFGNPTDRNLLAKQLSIFVLKSVHFSLLGSGFRLLVFGF